MPPFAVVSVFPPNVPSAKLVAPASKLMLPGAISADHVTSPISVLNRATSAAPGTWFASQFAAVLKSPPPAGTHVIVSACTAECAASTTAMEPPRINAVRRVARRIMDLVEPGEWVERIGAETTIETAILKGYFLIRAPLERSRWSFGRRPGWLAGDFPARKGWSIKQGGQRPRLRSFWSWLPAFFSLAGRSAPRSFSQAGVAIHYYTPGCRDDCGPWLEPTRCSGKSRLPSAPSVQRCALPARGFG